MSAGKSCEPQRYRNLIRLFIERLRADLPQDDFIRAMLKAARAKWYPTMLKLRVMAFRGSSSSSMLAGILAIWDEFGRAAGLEEERERARRDKNIARYCSWYECVYHHEESPDKLLQCRGCGEVRYCGRDHQRKDWKGDASHVAHKTICGNRLAG
ncbi:hypothetical protein OF83DRAFT_760283 [Amylostereum chailletii]|nr:hypothetical protein OF83DRAFT_760283 [Amylostereum chailletii]